MKYLFDSFKRVNEGSTKGIEGTGLGLSICSQLVNLMGGQITVDSIYQKGSTFTITIPQKIVNATPLGNLNYNSSSRHQRSSYKKSFEAPEAKVQEEREKLETYKQMKAQVSERLEGLKAKQSK